MDNIWDISFCEKLYEKELYRKEQIDKSIQFPTTVLTLLISAFFYVVKTSEFGVLRDNPFCVNGIFFVLFATAFIVMILLTIFFILMLFHNKRKKYLYLPSPLELKERQIELFKHFKQYNLEEDKLSKKGTKYVKRMFKQELIEYYYSCSDANQKVNENRLVTYFYLRRTLICSIIFLFLAIISIII